MISGGNRGKEGTVLSVDRKKDRVVVEGVNIVTKHVKPAQPTPGWCVHCGNRHPHQQRHGCRWCRQRHTCGRRRGDDGNWFVFLRKPMRS